jgi:hypothetical protein
MLILDLNYLDSVPEITVIDLYGGGKAKPSAAATSGWVAIATGKSTFTYGEAKNLAIAGKNSSAASSSVKVIASGDEDAFVMAFSRSSAGN